MIPDDGGEHFGVLTLDSAPHVLDSHEVGTCPADAVLSTTRDTLGPALRVPGCIAMIAMPNHPSTTTESLFEDYAVSCTSNKTTLTVMALFTQPSHRMPRIPVPASTCAASSDGWRRPVWGVLFLDLGKPLPPRPGPGW